MAGCLALLAAAGCLKSSGTNKTVAPATSSSPVAEPGSAVLAGEKAYPPPDPETAAACFAFIGDFRTFLRPCGCTPVQPGGVPRLGSILKTGQALLANAANPATPPDVKPPQVKQLRRLLGLPDLEEPPQPNAPQRLWLVECGDFNWIGTHNQDIRLSTYLNILHALGCRAIVPGAGELELRDTDAKAFAASAVPIVSCNLTLKQPLFPLQQSVELAPGWYVTGVSSWAALGSAPPQGSWWNLADPVASVKAVQAALPAGAKLVVVATYQPQPVIDALARLPLAGLVGAGHWVGGTTHEASGQTELPPAPEQGDTNLPAPVKLPAPPPRGAFLPLLRLYPGAAGLSGDTAFLPVDMTWPDDAPVQALLDKQIADLRDVFAAQRKQLYQGDGTELGMQNQFLPPDQQTFSIAQLKAKFAEPAHLMGSNSCTSCHAAANQVWAASKHASALDTLTAHEAENSVDCLQCHTVGLYINPGYDPDDLRTMPHEVFGAVGCESCHGPGSAHIAAARLVKQVPGDWPAPDAQWNGNKYSITRDDTQGCLKCHDSYNSPKFEAGSYWAKIKH